MKKITFWMMLSLFATTFFFSSCGDDVVEEMEEMMEEEEETVDTTITVADFTTDFDEIKNSATTEIFILGTVTASTNAGDLSYSIKSQTIADALAIDATTGELTASDYTKYDFETNEVVTGVIEVRNGTITKNLNVTVNINNLPEFYSLGGGTRSVSENVSDQEVLFTVSGTTDVGQIIFSVEDNDYFEVDANTGEISVIDGVNLDYESIVERSYGNSPKTIIVLVNGTNSIDNTVKGQVGVTILVNDVQGTDEVSERLYAGQTPAQIVAANAALEDDLYGKSYKGGIIATFNSSNGTGLVMTIDGNGTDRTWSQSNSYANSLVKNGFSDWRLMTEAEADVMCSYSSKVSENDYSGFWTSTNCGGICYVWKNFSNNDACGGGGSPGQFQTWAIVRAVRAY